MDFKFRLKQNEADNRKTAIIQNPRKSIPQTPNTGGWDRYARQTAPVNVAARQPSIKKQNAQSISQNTRLKSNLSRYYRSDAAPKNQFKRYLSDINNVFFQQRQSIKQMQLYQSIRWVTGIFWVILLIIFIMLSFIHPFQGECPHNAQCGVFVHCFNGFRYDKVANQCVLSQAYYGQIQEVVVNRIKKIRQEWANQQCNQSNQVSFTPKIQLSQVLLGIPTYSLKKSLKNKLQQFLENQQNQQLHHFDYMYQSQTIYPATKKYTLVCSAKIFMKTTNFKLGVPVVFILLGLLIYAFTLIRKRVIAQKIYQELRKKTFAQKLLNISYAKPDMEKQYGQIDQNLWSLIDELRSKDRDIGFLQDDFLYWKLL